MGCGGRRFCSGAAFCEVTIVLRVFPPCDVPKHNGNIVDTTYKTQRHKTQRHKTQRHKTERHKTQRHTHTKGREGAVLTKGDEAAKVETTNRSACLARPSLPPSLPPSLLRPRPQQQQDTNTPPPPSPPPPHRFSSPLPPSLQAILTQELKVQVHSLGVCVGGWGGISLVVTNGNNYLRL